MLSLSVLHRLPNRLWCPPGSGHTNPAPVASSSQFLFMSLLTVTLYPNPNAKPLLHEHDLSLYLSPKLVSWTYPFPVQSALAPLDRCAHVR